VTAAHAADAAGGFAKPRAAYAPLVLALVLSLPGWAIVSYLVRAWAR
jgi:hypothetical protein